MQSPFVLLKIMSHMRIGTLGEIMVEIIEFKDTECIIANYTSLFFPVQFSIVTATEVLNLKI